MTEQTAVYIVGEGTDITSDDIFVRYGTESDVLRAFWQGAVPFDTFVSFEGRRVVAPLLIHRSRCWGVLPTRSLMEGRYPSQQHTCRHIDLLEELAMYGVWKYPRDISAWAEVLHIPVPVSPRQGVKWQSLCADSAQVQSLVHRIDIIKAIYTRLHPPLVSP
jgi:hypothetical protein